MVLPGSCIEAAHVRAERIRVSFAENCQFILNRQVNATVSGGVAMNVTAEQSLDALLEISDAALYDAKSEGRNRIKRADQPQAVGGMSNVFRVRELSTPVPQSPFAATHTPLPLWVTERTRSRGSALRAERSKWRGPR